MTVDWCFGCFFIHLVMYIIMFFDKWTYRQVVVSDERFCIYSLLTSHSLSVYMYLGYFLSLYLVTISVKKL